MKVILINPPSPFLIDQKAFSPLGILYLAASLRRNNINVKVLDLAHEEDNLEELISRNLEADLYGLTATTPQYPWAQKIKEIIKRHKPQSRVILGGTHASSVPQKCLRDKFDAVVLGEGEEAVVEIARQIESKSNIPEIVKKPYIKDMNTIPFPARDMIDFKLYGYQLNGGKAATVITSRGCPYSCAFCSKDVWQRSLRFHDVDYIIEEIKQIISNYGFKYFLFLDDSLTFNKKRLLDLMEKIKPLNIKWRCYARTKSTTKDMLSAMKEAGCIEIGVGVESGSQKILDNINKQSKVEDNTRFVKECKEAGIMCNVFIMIGLPGETKETVMETKRWMEETRPNKFGFNIFMPYVGTPIYEHPEKYDITLFEVKDEYSWIKGKQGGYHAFIETPGLKREEILNLFGELFEYYTDLTKWQPGIGKKQDKDR